MTEKKGNENSTKKVTLREWDVKRTREKKSWNQWGRKENIATKANKQENVFGREC